jgi:hypothetical protein
VSPDKYISHVTGKHTLQLQIDSRNIKHSDSREMPRLGHGEGRANDDVAECGKLLNQVQGNQALIFYNE